LNTFIILFECYNLSLEIKFIDLQYYLLDYFIKQQINDNQLLLEILEYILNESFNSNDNLLFNTIFNFYQKNKNDLDVTENYPKITEFLKNQKTEIIFESPIINDESFRLYIEDFVLNSYSFLNYNSYSHLKIQKTEREDSVNKSTSIFNQSNINLKLNIVSKKSITPREIIREDSGTNSISSTSSTDHNSSPKVNNNIKTLITHHSIPSLKKNFEEKELNSHREMTLKNSEINLQNEKDIKENQLEFEKNQKEIKEIKKNNFSIKIDLEKIKKKNETKIITPIDIVNIYSDIQIKNPFDNKIFYGNKNILSNYKMFNDAFSNMTNLIDEYEITYKSSVIEMILKLFYNHEVTLEINFSDYYDIYMILIQNELYIDSIEYLKKITQYFTKDNYQNREEYEKMIQSIYDIYYTQASLYKISTDNEEIDIDNETDYIEYELNNNFNMIFSKLKEFILLSEDIDFLLINLNIMDNISKKQLIVYKKSGIYNIYKEINEKVDQMIETKMISNEKFMEIVHFYNDNDLYFDFNKTNENFENYLKIFGKNEIRLLKSNFEMKFENQKIKKEIVNIKNENIFLKNNIIEINDKLNILFKILNNQGLMGNNDLINK
jgi:hypothetical protein